MEYFLVLLNALINSIYSTNQTWLNVLSIRKKFTSVGLKIVIRNLAGEIEFRCQTKINEFRHMGHGTLQLYHFRAKCSSHYDFKLKISSNIKSIKASLGNTEIGLIKY